MANKNLSEKQAIQESEYFIPYHYIPEKDGHGFSQTLFWSWGMRYFAGIELVLAQLRQLSFSSVIDIGCGDGRFLREVSKAFPGKSLLGVDYSGAAIALAKALNPDLNYVCLDIANDETPGQFDVATMIEVLEHIPPNEIDSFLEGVSKSITSNGTLILTVPHENKRVQNKHFQHFSSQKLRKILASHFHVEHMMPFDRISKIDARLSRILGYQGNNYIKKKKKLNGFLYKRILRNCFEEQPENRCGRLLAIAKKA